MGVARTQQAQRSDRTPRGEPVVDGRLRAIADRLWQSKRDVPSPGPAIVEVVRGGKAQPEGLARRVPDESVSKMVARGRPLRAG